MKNQGEIISKEEKEQGWELLFDGKSFAGWRGLGRDTVETNHWKVENGMIHKLKNDDVPALPNGEKINGGDLMTIDTFDSFELSFEWKILGGGNSGIKYNVSEKSRNPTVQGLMHWVLNTRFSTIQLKFTKT